MLCAGVAGADKLGLSDQNFSKYLHPDSIVQLERPSFQTSHSGPLSSKESRG